MRYIIYNTHIYICKVSYIYTMHIYETYIYIYIYRDRCL